MKTPYLTLFALSCALLAPSLLANELSQPGQELIVEPRKAECLLPPVDDSGLEQALKFCTGQAELGYAQAQYMLGNYWYEGVLTEPDFARALHWYEQASIQGHADAQFRLGQMHAAGEGVTINKPQAYVILKMSAVNGSDDAYDATDWLESDMTATELEQANQMLSRLFRRYLRQISDPRPEPRLTEPAP